jgi:hypothetical protein
LPFKVTARTVNHPCRTADNVRVAGYLVTGPWTQFWRHVRRYHEPLPVAPDAFQDDQVIWRIERLASPLKKIRVGLMPQYGGEPAGKPAWQNVTVGGSSADPGVVAAEEPAGPAEHAVVPDTRTAMAMAATVSFAIVFMTSSGDTAPPEV